MRAVIAIDSLKGSNDTRHISQLFLVSGVIPMTEGIGKKLTVVFQRIMMYVE